MPVDVVVVAYRSARHLTACLDAIGSFGSSVERTIVVDNSSPDESAEIAERHPLGPDVVRLPTNVGFGGGCNAGAGVSAASEILFLNPDALVEPGAVEALAAGLDRDPRVGAVGARLVDPDGELTAASAGAEPSIRSVAGHFLLLSRLPFIGRLFPPLQLADAARHALPDWVSGGAMLVRRSAFDAVGGFDERFFLYMEDVDLCRRLREAGWTIRYEPSAVVRHAIGGSQSEDQPARWYRAFHAYLAQRRGGPAARFASAIAAVGLAARWSAYRGRRPAQARRMRLAARTAARLALTPGG